MNSNIRIREIETFLAMTRCRVPLKFGNVVVDELPIGYARATVENGAGKVAQGWGAIFLMDLWAWPVSTASHAQKNAAMCELFTAYAKVVESHNAYAHPIEIFMETKPELERLNREICTRHTPNELMPYIGALIAASPIDHALHDAFGRVNNIDSYLGYSAAHMDFDLSRYLGDAFQGVYPAQFLRQEYLPSLPIFHLVGGLDVLRQADVQDTRDGLPNSLDKWIAQDGVYCLKVKLVGNDMQWDIDRTLQVSQIYHEVHAQHRPDLPARPVLTADTNEQCESPDYVVEYLTKIREAAPTVFDEILYIEQPTERDLEQNRWDMRPIARLKPVLVDESLSTIDDFYLAQELGWSGIALKSCKCLTNDLLLIALAEMNGVPYALQDLTNPSLALIQSVGLAARTHTIKGVEFNSRQFFPDANALAAQVHPDLYTVKNGKVRTSSIQGSGLGFQVDKLAGFEEFVRREHAEFLAMAQATEH